jgi:hypothetical protein
MLSPIVVNVVESEVERGQSLCEKKKMQTTDTRKKILTVLFFRASARYWIPLSAILLHTRSSVVSVCMRKKRCKQYRQKKKRYWPCYFSEHQLDIGPHSHPLHSLRRWVWSMPVWEGKCANHWHKKTYSPYSFSEHQLDIGPHRPQFHCCWCRMWLVSVREWKGAKEG